MTRTVHLCDSTEERAGKPCRCAATWLIGVGTRTVDRQYACGRHLHAAGLAMLAAESRPGASLTVLAVAA